MWLILIHWFMVNLFHSESQKCFGNSDPVSCKSWSKRTYLDIAWDISWRARPPQPRMEVDLFHRESRGFLQTHDITSEIPEGIYNHRKTIFEKVCVNFKLIWKRHDNCLIYKKKKTRTTIVVSNRRYTFYQTQFIKYNLSNTFIN